MRKIFAFACVFFVGLMLHNCGGSKSAKEDIFADGAWTSPLSLQAGVVTVGTDPEIAVNEEGIAVAVWTSNLGVVARRFTPASGWELPVRIDGASGNGGWNPQVAVDSLGNAMAVWCESGSVWAARYRSGIGWDVAVRIGLDNATDAVTPKVAMDKDGNAIAVWVQYEDLPLYVTPGTSLPTDATPRVIIVGGAATMNIWANRYNANTGWGAPELIDTGIGAADSPQIAIVADGSAFAVWCQSDYLLGGDNDRETYKVFSRKFAPGVGWESTSLIGGEFASGVEAPRVIVDHFRNATVAWRQNDGIWVNRYVEGAGWNTPVVISGTGSVSPQLAADSNGNILAVWWQSDGVASYVWSGHYFNSTGWSTKELISANVSGDAWAAQVAMEPSGNATAVWMQDGGIFSRRYKSGIGWDVARRIDGNTPYSCWDPQVAMDKQGNSIVVWAHYDGLNTAIWSNRFSMY